MAKPVFLVDGYFVLTASLVFFATGAGQAAQPSVETQGLTRKIIAEHVLTGPLTEIDGKYKMVAVEFAIDPGGYVGPHLHAGPGYRCVIHGVITNVETDGKSTDYHPGECYFEGGDVSHTPRNNGDTVAVGIQVELLPAAWQGSSLLPVTK